MPPSTKKIVPDNNSSAHFKAARKALGLTQQELADRLLLSQNYVAQIEMGRKHPSGRVLTTLETLTKAIDSGSTAAPSGEVRDEQAPYGTPSTLEAEARRHLDSVIVAARGEPARLGWIVEQLQAHVSAPVHWRGSSGPLIRVTTPSQTQDLSSETGLPVPAPSRRARSA